MDSDKKSEIDILKEKVERYKKVIKSAGLSLWDWYPETGEIYLSTKWKNQIGYEDHELESTFSTWEQLLHPDESEKVLRYVNSYVQKPIKPFNIEYRIRHKNGTYRWILASGSVQKNEEGKVIRVFGSHADITERKEVELKFRAISNQSTEGITVADMEGNYVFVNPAFCEMSGYSERELLKLTVFDMKAKNQPSQSFYDSKEKMEGIPIRVNLQRKDGTEYWTEIIGDVITINGRQLVLGTIRDITDREKAIEKIKKLNENLESLVEERTTELSQTVANLNEEIKKRILVEEKINEALEIKEVLLKEITHRVKNNLQVICSLINLQKASIKDKDSVEVLNITANRIYSMSLIHETLHKSNDFGQVRFKDYVESLVQYTIKTFDISNIEIEMDIEDFILSIGTATNCGLIVMELITNSIKYAFPENQKGIIQIKMKSTGENTYQLVFGDNGIGFPSNIDINQTESLGMQLVVTLTEQLDGTMKLTDDKGAVFEFVIQDIKES